MEPVEANGVPSELLTPPGADPKRVILYVHGGGYSMGSRNSHREMAARVSKAAQVPVLLVGYRLAPEFSHPAALDDVTAGFQFLLSQGFDPKRIALVGDSAGGGLAVAALVATRDAGLSLPACLACLSPWVDLTLESARTMTEVVSDPVNTIDGLSEMVGLYIGDSPPNAPSISPLFADLTGLPPMLVQVGTAELLLADARLLVAYAQAAGVKAELDEYENLIHVFQHLAGGSKEAALAVGRLGSFISEHTSV
ncbi:MAG TPA: alpha/beta hydrolase [Acidimicrobiales bacterium]|nr:alpha/beta hydrolase [Acidimicrobiales bacterium]